MPITIPDLKRRQTLKFIAGTPVLLPLGATATSLLAGCGGDDDKPVFKSARFIGMPSPTAVADLAKTTVASSLEVTLTDDSKHTYKLAYQPFFLTGTAVPDGKGGTILSGGYYDINNKAFNNPATGTQLYSNCPDGASFITIAGAKVDGVKGNTVFCVVQFEYVQTLTAASFGGTEADLYGRVSSPIAVLTLDQDPGTGKLTLVKYHNVDTSKVYGLWITCGASLSPWSTHLSSEEYEPDAFDQGLGGQTLAVLRDFSTNVYGSPTAASPYNYGHLPEVTVNPDGTGSIKKHFNLGRISRELVHVMPDNRTVLMGDDYTNGGLFMFVADKEKDLSAGTLYVAKYTSQLTETTTGNISWIKLGSATSAEIEALAHDATLTTIATSGDIKENGILASTKVDPGDASYTPIMINKTKAWVKIKNAKAAAFLETHRYAASKGASMAFTKMEGTTLNVQDKIAYSALANIQDSMVEGGSGYIAGNNVKFKKLVAGGVVAHKLGSGAKDTDGNAVNSEWAPLSSSLLIAGEDIAGDSLGNTANVGKIASPDNLKFSEKLRTLFIGEDSGNHLNNYLWAYNLDTKELQRLLSTPAGAESTGLHAADDINGWFYISSNFQHAGDEMGRFPTLDAATKTQIQDALKTNYGNYRQAAVGYLTGDFTVDPKTAAKLG